MSTRPRPEHLLAAYVEASGIRVTMSRQRHDWLRQICAMPHNFNAEDVLRVITGIQYHQNRGTSGYTSASLLFSNAMNPERFEERALQHRATLARQQQRQAALDAKASAAPSTPAEPSVPLEVFNQGMADLKRQLRGGGGR